MTTRARALAESVRASGPLLTRYLAGFHDANHTTQAQGMPNNVAWTLGHVALTLHRCAELSDHKPLPDSDFREDAPAHSGRIPMRYYADSVAYGSQPVDDPLVYPSLESAVLIYERAVERLAQAVDNCNDESLDQHHAWGSGTLPFDLLVSRMIFHAGMHAGQVADLRRALGLGSIF